MMVKQMTKLSPRKVGSLDFKQIENMGKFVPLHSLSMADMANLKSQWKSYSSHDIDLCNAFPCTI